MRWWWVTLALGACNQLYGLDKTVLLDGTGVGPDAPFACPAGEPRYTGIVKLWSTRGCYGYTTSTTGVGAAECYDSDAIEVGPVDGMLAPGPGLLSRNNFDEPRMAPEGNELVLHSSSELRVYRLTAGTWTQAGTLPRPTSNDIEASTPSRSPDRHVLLFDGTRVYEYASSGGAWTDTGQSYALGDLGVTEIKRMTLSPDALRLVFYGHDATSFGAFYAGRQSVTARFGVARLLDGVPSLPYGDPFMSADCGRLYYATDNSMLYVVQQL